MPWTMWTGRLASSLPMTDARAVSNRHLSCDWCGSIPATLFLPTNRAGVFCEECLVGVLDPPAVELATDDAEAGFVAIGKKLDLYLKRFQRQPTFCGRGRPRKNPVPLKASAESAGRRDQGTQHWKYFSRTDAIRITKRDTKFRGVRARVWNLLSDGAVIAEIMNKGKATGLPEAQVAATLRKMLVVYRAGAVVRPTRDA